MVGSARGVNWVSEDGNGNLKSDGTRSYSWDEENHVTATSGATYQYDALGRRTAKTVSGVTTHYVYDGWQAVQEVRSDGVTKSFAYGNYIDEPVCMITTTAASSDTVYYLQGNNYNISALTDERGRVVERYDVEPYGAFAVFTGKGADGTWFTGDDVQASASAVGNEIVFQGRTVDEESGDYYFRNRQYGPGVGRFLGRDPIGYTDGPNLYQAYFVPNSLDPSGERGFSKRTVQGPTLGNCGKIYWQIEWQINPSSGAKGGYVIQTIDLTYDVKDCKGKTVNDETSLYQEAFAVGPRQSVSSDRDEFDLLSKGTCTKGSVSVIGSASYYEALSLPSDFSANTSSHAGVLPQTQSVHAYFPLGSNSVSHNLTIKWDCCKGESKTEIVEIQ